MLYRHVFGRISSEFRGISRLFGKFRGISRIYLNLAAPRPREILEALLLEWLGLALTHLITRGGNIFRQVFCTENAECQAQIIARI